MFWTSFQTVFLGLLQVMSLAGCGYFLFRRKMIDQTGIALLSRLVVNVFLPCFIFDHLLTEFTFSQYPYWWVFPLISFGVTLSGFGVGHLLVRIFKKVPDRSQAVALMSFQNSGYLPLLLIANIFQGPQAQTLYVYIFLFLIGFDLATWSLGVWLLTHQKLDRFDLRQMVNAPIVSIGVSLLIVFLGFKSSVPEMIFKPMQLLGACTLPLSMLVVGGSLAQVLFSKAHWPGIGVIILGKLLILPVLALGVVQIIKPDFLVGFLIVLEAAVPSAISLSVIAQQHRLQDEFLSQGLVVTHLVSMVSLPIFLSIYLSTGR